MISLTKNLNRVLSTSKNFNIFEKFKINTTLSAVNYPRRFQSQQFKEEYKKAAIASFEENYQTFMDAFPKFVEDFTSMEEVSLIKDRLTNSLNYNVPHGKRLRGLFILTVYKLLVGEENLTEENIYEACLMGWFNEVFQAVSLIMDDITDKDDMRRGQAAWYKRPEIGNLAIVDGLLLYHGGFKLFKNKFGHKKNFVKMMSVFNRDYFDTVIGQLIDCEVVPMDQFTMERYELLNTYKCIIYSALLPWYSALNVAEIDDPKLEETGREILFIIGYANQALDDVLDVYNADASDLCTDILYGKASWIISRALTVANEEQKKMLMMNYGRNDRKCVENVRKIFDELGMKELFFKDLAGWLTKVDELCHACPNKKIGAFLSQVARNTMQRNC